MLDRKSSLFVNGDYIGPTSNVFVPVTRYERKKPGLAADCDFSISFEYDECGSLTFDLVNIIKPTRCDIEFKPTPWFAPRIFLFDVLIDRVSLDSEIEILNINMSGDGKLFVFAKWWHRPIWWIYWRWKKLKKWYRAWIEKLDRDTFHKISARGFTIEFNWRGFTICRPAMFWYRVAGIRWWKPKIIWHARCGSTTTSPVPPKYDMLIQLYPTDNMTGRLDELAVLYRENRRRHGRVKSFVAAARRKIYATCVRKMILDNLGFAFEVPNDRT